MTPLRMKLGDVLWKSVFRPYLFRMDAERAHVTTIDMLKQFQKEELLWVLRLLYRSPYCEAPITVFGTDWRNPVGLAAGFDKQGEVICALDALGLGSIEIGTGSPLPQPGNDRPRVFRYPHKRAIINRYGFNSDGLLVIGERYRETVSRSKIAMPIGISIGKNKATQDDKAVDDYIKALGLILPLRPQDWVKINISSPNTPNLRAIFNRLDEFLASFVERAAPMCRDAGWHPRFVLKMPPDGLEASNLEEVVAVAAKHGFVGIEATNTTTDEAIKRSLGLFEAGGLSGEPLRGLANEKLGLMRSVAREHNIDLVGVGGIMSGADAVEKRALGARAVQIYSGLVFRGPLLIHEILEAWR